jgi:hypothetical protein
MDPAVAGTAVSAPPLTFEDGLGERRYTISAGHQPLEILRLNTSLSAVSSFDFALRERALRLANFRHQWYGHVRAVELDKLTSALMIVSDYVPGVRLSTLLQAADRRSVPLEADAARCLIRQLVSAVAAWQEILPDVCHGAIGPERIVVTPQGRLVIVEYVLGAALEQLRYSRAHYWRQLRVALPEAPEPLPFDARADVTQIGVVALSLILGRLITGEEYPSQIKRLVAGATLRSTMNGAEPISADLRDWLMRALQLDDHRSFISANDARVDLDAALGSQDLSAELRALRLFVARCGVRTAADGSPIGLREASAPDPSSRPRPSVPSAEDVPFDSAQERSFDAAPPKTEVSDLAPRIEALKAFLARYPSRRLDDASPAASESGVATVAAVHTLPIAPTSRIQPVPDSRIDTGRVEERADPPAADEAASTVLHTFAPEPVAGLRELPGQEPQEWKGALPLRVLGSRRSISIGIALAVIAVLAFVLSGPRFFSSAAAKTTGALTVGTDPAGISVVIDGTSRGVTPLNVELPPGEHVLELVTGSENRRVPVTITAGGQVSQFFELRTAAAEYGELMVRTDRPGVSVTVDGNPAGRTPVSVPDLTPGTHTVVLQNETGSVTENVVIESGRTASLVVSMAASATNAAGWISVSAPTDVQVFENGRLLGSSRIDRIMLPVGRHELEIVNETLGYRSTHRVQVAAGQTASIRPAWPQGTLALNAIPWAEVWIDGELVGETPIGNVSLPIGVHEVVFRNPELGERRSSVTVTVGKPTTVGVDLRSK